VRSKGVFISIDGVDGGGKTGAIVTLEARLRSLGHDLVVTREPGGTDEGLALRKLLLASDAYDWSPTAELLLVNAARTQHVVKVIRPAIEAGKIVICDRYAAATLAYQGAGRGIPTEQILELHRIAVADLWPDLTVLLDISAAKGLERSRKRLNDANSNEGRFEALDLAFHERVRNSYLDQARAWPERYAVIDADRPPDIVRREVVETVTVAIARIRT
jgi:dTMP kinase